jgi:hypothetical protein
VNKREARRLMHEADRDRARIAYSGIDFDRWSDARCKRAEEKNCDTPEYREAEERFSRYSAIVGDAGPRDLVI